MRERLIVETHVSKSAGDDRNSGGQQDLRATQKRNHSRISLTLTAMFPWKNVVHVCVSGHTATTFPWCLTIKFEKLLVLPALSLTPCVSGLARLFYIDPRGFLAEPELFTFWTSRLLSLTQGDSLEMQLNHN